MGQPPLQRLERRLRLPRPRGPGGARLHPGRHGPGRAALQRRRHPHGLRPLSRRRRLGLQQDLRRPLQPGHRPERDPDPSDPAWQQSRRDQVTAFVHGLHDAIQGSATGEAERRPDRLRQRTHQRRRVPCYADLQRRLPGLGDLVPERLPRPRRADELRPRLEPQPGQVVPTPGPPGRRTSAKATSWSASGHS